jgi:hypothetical protein
MNGPFPRSAEMLLAIFADAVARAGNTCFLLELDEACNEQSDAQWLAFVERQDSVAFVSWCADKLRHWKTPAYIARQAQAPVFGDMPCCSFVITSPDGHTDLTPAAWAIYVYINAKNLTLKPFSEHYMQDVESAPTFVNVADLARISAALHVR